MRYERTQKATTVEIGKLYQIDDGRIDTIRLMGNGKTSHFNKQCRLITALGNQGNKLHEALAAGILWEVEMKQDDEGG